MVVETMPLNSHNISYNSSDSVALNVATVPLTQVIQTRAHFTKKSTIKMDDSAAATTSDGGGGRGHLQLLSNGTTNSTLSDTSTAAVSDEDDFICIINEPSSPDGSFELIHERESTSASQSVKSRSSTVTVSNEDVDNHYCNSNATAAAATATTTTTTTATDYLNHRSNSTNGISDIVSDQILLNKSFKSKSLSNSPFSRSNCHNPPNDLISFSSLQQWIYCIAVVNFDIEIGQSIECIFPCDVQLTEREKSNICYLSFPDSNSGCMGDTQFYFRTRACTIKRPCFDLFYKDFNSKCLQTLQIDQSYFYGFVYFRQVKDRSVRRGYFQKSLVILSWFPFVSLFSKILKILAPQFFEVGVASLEAACSDINRWPAPVTGQIVNLALLGTVTQVLIPDDKYNYSLMCQMNQINLKKFSISSSSLSLKSLSLKLKRTKDNYDDSSIGTYNHHQSSPDTPPSPYPSSRQLVTNVANDINIYRGLLPVIAHIQLLWELVLTCEPLAVITQSPNICSDVVLALVSCITPLRYGADYRPFFTIHDSEFKEYTSQTRSPPPLILGVTNPFFVKTLQDWPHIIKINDFTLDQKIKGVNINSSLKKSHNKSLDMKTGVYTKYKPYLSKDREILKKILKGIESTRPSEAQNALLRRFFIELTQSFLIPLERYFASLMPLAKNLSPFKRPPILQHFKIEDFINSLDATGPHLTTGIKGDWTGLYRRFLRSPNFVCWYNSRMQEANDKLLTLHIEAICDANLAELINDKPEVEIVDLILKLKENLNTAERGHLSLSSFTVHRLKSNMNNIISKLPEDSRSLFERQDQ